MLELTREIPKPGFNFENCTRNAQLIQSGFVMPKAVKTGTTIAGILFKDGVILGADTRATEGPIVSDKNCGKIHYLTKNIYCCGAGTAADTENITNMVSSQLEMHRLNTEREILVVAANTILKQMLFRYQGHISAALVLGGVDRTGAYIYSIHPHGSTDKLPYISMGSGSLAAMSIFETRWRPDLAEDEAKILVRDAIAAGIFNDLGSGSNVDLCVIRRNSQEFFRNFEIANKKGERKLKYNFDKGATKVHEIRYINFEVIAEGVTPMDTS